MKTPKTHFEKAQRRKNIAAFVKDGHDVNAAARRWDVSRNTAEEACRVYGVLFEKFDASAKNNRLLRIVASLCKGEGTLSEVGRSFDVSREYVRQVMKRCRLTGVPVASRYK